MSLRSIVALLLALSFVATACGGSGDDDSPVAATADEASQSNEQDSSDDGSGDSGESGDNDNSEGSSNDADSDGEPSGSPLSDFLGNDLFGFDGDNEAAQAEYEAQERKRQEKVVECMRAQGFEHKAQDPSQYSFFEEADGLEYGSREWVEKYGFGATTQSFSQSQLGDGLVGYDDSGNAEREFEDPNDEYVSSLGEAEREAYYAALYGNEPDIDMESLSEEEIDEFFENFQPDGCDAEAREDDDQYAFYNDFSDELQEMYEAIQADPRVIEAEAKIAACVSDKGLVYVSQEEVYEYFYAKIEPMQASLYNNFEDPAADLDFETMSEEEIEAFYEAIPEPQLSDEDKALLGEIQAEEIELALAVTDCGGGFDQQQDLFRELQKEYEQKFLDDNAEALETYRDSQG